MKILVTGAAGYIGAHVIQELHDRGFTDLHAIDNEMGISPNQIAGALRSGLDCDILSSEADKLLRQDFDVIIHLAALISVEESTQKVAEYWRNNLLSTNKILDHQHGAHLIFASTGTAFCPENPYAWSKVACEQEIRDRSDAHTIFRFYNVSGLRPGCYPTGNPTHLIRRAAMAARGLIQGLTIYGTDWDTPDGTCVRDYIHVMDLAASIVNAIDLGPTNTPYECLGSGTGYSVKEVVTSMKKVSGVDFNVTMAERRPGDVASMICPTQYSGIVLNHTLDDMCLSAYEGIK